MRQLGCVLLLLGAIGLALACGDDDDKTKTDGGTSTADGAGTADSGGTTTDGGGSVDLVTGKGSCKSITACTGNCNPSDSGYDGCITSCKNEGAAQAQQLFDAFATCAALASEGACSEDCSGSDYQTCTQCTTTACKTEWDACQADG
jgi:hypothetical protein